MFQTSWAMLGSKGESKTKVGESSINTTVVLQLFLKNSDFLAPLETAR